MGYADNRLFTLQENITEKILPHYDISYRTDFFFQRKRTMQIDNKDWSTKFLQGKGCLLLTNHIVKFKVSEPKALQH